MRFKKTRRGIEAKLDEVESAILARCATDLLELLGADDVDQDPLEAMVGMPAGDVRRPDDPALARLFPDAHGDDEAAATEFRRYTETDLRTGKRANASTVLAMLPRSGGTVTLDREGADAWLGFLNDLRLVMGSRLEVTEDTDPWPDGDDPHAQALHVYGWLGYLQESLVGCLLGRR